MKKLFFWPDMHTPAHHQVAVQVALNALEEYGPDVFVILGDFLDMYGLGSHKNKIPGLFPFQMEIDYGRQILDCIEARLPPGCRKIFLMGNHEYRHDRFYMNDAPELYGVESIESYLRLNETGWEVVPYAEGKEGVQLGKLFVAHDVGKAGMYIARSSLTVEGGSILVGHGHRLQSWYGGTRSGLHHVGFGAGWLGDPDHVAFNYVRTPIRADWQHGFATGRLFDDGDFLVQLSAIVDGRTLIDGKVIKS